MENKYFQGYADLTDYGEENNPILMQLRERLQETEQEIKEKEEELENWDGTQGDDNDYEDVKASIDNLYGYMNGIKFAINVVESEGD